MTHLVPSSTCLHLPWSDLAQSHQTSFLMTTMCVVRFSSMAEPLPAAPSLRPRSYASPRACTGPVSRVPRSLDTPSRGSHGRHSTVRLPHDATTTTTRRPPPRRADFSPDIRARTPKVILSPPPHQNPPTRPFRLSTTAPPSLQRNSRAIQAARRTSPPPGPLPTSTRAYARHKICSRAASALARSSASISASVATCAHAIHRQPHPHDDHDPPPQPHNDARVTATTAVVTAQRPRSTVTASRGSAPWQFRRACGADADPVKVFVCAVRGARRSRSRAD